MKFLWRHAWWIMLALVLLATVAGAVFWLSQSSLMAIETIEVEGNRSVPVEQILETATPLLMGESLMRISYDELERSLTAMPFIEAVEFERGFPHTLRVRVQERQAGANLAAAEGRLLLLSSEGYVLAELEAADESYPVISTSEACAAEVGEVPDCPDVKVGVRFVTDIPTSFNQGFSDVAVEQGYIRARTMTGALVTFGTLDDYGLKFEVLRQLLARTAAQGMLVIIDVSVPERPVTREGEAPAAANIDDEVPVADDGINIEEGGVDMEAPLEADNG